MDHNDDHARKLAERAALWIQDPLYHPNDADKENQMIEDEI